ncbi:MAG TPA: hypothetical protein DCR93_21190, partial [Cytophagales bacterium]|nr:hypothetical protein [Cytophagales bacterium]
CDDIDWTRDASGTPSSGTGPTSGSAGSWYMYMESSAPNYPSKDANLYATVDLSGESSATLEFDYHYQGSSASTMVLQASTNGGSSFSTLWTMPTSSNSSWRSASVSLDSYAGGDVILQFAATTGASWQGDVAIDDLSITTSGGGGGGGGTTEDCGSASNLSRSTGQWQYFTWTVPSNSQGTTITTTGSNGDADLYVRWGANPTTSNYTARSISATSNESISITGSGTLNIGIYAYSTFSGLSVQACNTVPATASTAQDAPELSISGEVVETVGFQVFPNPASDRLSVATAFDLNTDAPARVYTITGQVALETETANLREGIDIAGLQKGVYFIQVQDAKGQVRTQQFVKN